MLASITRISRKRLAGGFIALVGFITLFAAARIFGLTINIPGISESTIRDIAHFSVFGCLAFLTAKFLGNQFLAAFFLCLIIATLEEIHQMFVPYRYCSLGDWLIDVAGMIAFLTLGRIFEKPLRKFLRNFRKSRLQ